MPAHVFCRSGRCRNIGIDPHRPEIEVLTVGRNTLDAPMGEHGEYGEIPPGLAIADGQRDVQEVVIEAPKLAAWLHQQPSTHACVHTCE